MGLRGVALLTAKLAVLAVAVLAVTATGAPYYWTRVLDEDRVSSLNSSNPSEQYLVTVCGPRPYTGGSFPFDDPARTEVAFFVANTTGTVVVDVHRGGDVRTFSIQDTTTSTNVAEWNVEPKGSEPGPFCDRATILTVKLGEQRHAATIRWHLRLDYLEHLDAERGTSPTLRVEPIR